MSFVSTSSQLIRTIRCFSNYRLPSSCRHMLGLVLGRGFAIWIGIWTCPMVYSWVAYKIIGLFHISYRN